MRKRIFFLADPHFDHERMVGWTRRDRRTCSIGEAQCDEACKNEHPLLQVRSFGSAAEMTETIIANWNDTVRPQDIGYIVGDVALGKESLSHVLRLNGHLRLIDGNHDIYYKEYRKYFEKTMAMRQLDDLLITHIPVHPACLRRYRANVHGHTHSWTPTGGAYINISAEQISYKPVSLDELVERAKRFPAPAERTEHATA